MFEKLSLGETKFNRVVSKENLSLLTTRARRFTPILAVIALTVAALFVNRRYISIGMAGDILASDVVEYLYWGNVVAHEQSAQHHIFVDYSYGIDQPSKVAPGIPVVFATIHALTAWDINTYQSVLPSLLLIWSLAGIYVVLRRITVHRWSPVLALALFVFGQSEPLLWGGINPTFARSIHLYYTLSPANAVGFCLIIAILIVLTYAASKPSDIRLYLTAAILIGYAVVVHQLTPIVLGPLVLIFALCFFKHLPWRGLLVLGICFVVIGWLARPLYLSIDSVGLLSSSKSSGASFYASSAVSRQDLPLRIGMIAVFASSSGLLWGISIALSKRSISHRSFVFSLGWLPILVVTLTSASIGINAVRFENYLWINLLPVAAIGIDGLLSAHSGKRTYRIAWASLFLVIVIGSYFLSLPLQRFPPTTQVLDRTEREAAKWLATQLQNRTDVIAGDIQSASDSRGIRSYFLNQALIRPSQSFLPAVPAPYDRPVKVLDKVLNDPLDFASIAEGYKTYQLKYFFFTRNGVDTVRKAVADSPYFVEVYRNDAAEIFALSPIFYSGLNGQ